MGLRLEYAGPRFRGEAPRYAGVLVILIAVTGYAVIGWRFGETGDMIPLVGGVLCVVIASWTIYRQRR
jgi:hypothetical protein